MEIKIYVANLSAYNEGKLIGEWLTLPLEDEELQEQIEEVIEAGGGEEVAIHDYEAPFSISEYQSITELNKMARRLEDLDEYEEEIVKHIFDYFVDYDEALECIENNEYRTYEECYDMADVAHEVVEEQGVLHDAPELLARYFDYEAYGRDLEIEGNFIYCGGGTYLELYM